MTKQKITLEEVLSLVEFYKGSDGKCYVNTVKGDCGTVKGRCGTVESSCGIVGGSCDIVRGGCGTVEGDCGTVKGGVLTTINGRYWHYTETHKQRLERLIEEGADKAQLLEAVNQLEGS